MTCHEVRVTLSLYLYGELDFAQEEAIEQHVNECSVCKHALEREKAWHAAANAEHTDVPLELLSQCRGDLKTALSSARSRQYVPLWTRWGKQLGVSPSVWSMRLAAASFLVFLGFTGGRWMDRGGLGSDSPGGLHAGLFDPSTSHIRDIQASDGHRVRMVIDQIREQQVEGSLDEGGIRRLILAGVKDSVDPGIRVDAVELLKDESGSDVRDALAYAARHDPNAGVRLKALEGLRRFSDDPVARESVRKLTSLRCCVTLTLPRKIALSARNPLSVKKRLSLYAVVRLGVSVSLGTNAAFCCW